MKDKYETAQNIIDKTLTRRSGKEGKAQPHVIVKSMEEGSATNNLNYKEKGFASHKNISPKERKSVCKFTLDSEVNSSQNNHRCAVYNKKQLVIRNGTFVIRYTSVGKLRYEISTGRGTYKSYEELQTIDHDSMNCSGDEYQILDENNNESRSTIFDFLKSAKNIKWWIYGFIIDKYVFMITQIKLQYTNDTVNKLQLSVVTSEMFEEAMRASQISMIELTFTHLFPSDCRMFIAIPIYKDGYIHRKDQL
ncbi:uncharacterized protein LOC132754625 isoform X2 [Ruditapes philippinarum]|nr:uncharacterized protein LOC132754625 isoform X2 [Ruditapes philippinarum]